MGLHLPHQQTQKQACKQKTVLSEIYRTPNCVGLLKAILVISNPSHTRLHLFKRNCYASFPMAQENAAFRRQQEHHFSLRCLRQKDLEPSV